MDDKKIPASTLRAVGTRLNSVESKGFDKLVDALGHEGHGAQARAVREVLRGAMIERGFIDKRP